MEETWKRYEGGFQQITQGFYTWDFREPEPKPLRWEMRILHSVLWWMARSLIKSFLHGGLKFYRFFFCRISSRFGMWIQPTPHFRWPNNRWLRFTLNLVVAGGLGHGMPWCLRKLLNYHRLVTGGLSSGDFTQSTCFYHLYLYLNI
jgi:hypothetical protein